MSKGNHKNVAARSIAGENAGLLRGEGILQNHNNYYNAQRALVSSPDPTLCEGKGLVTVERFLGFYKLSSHVFV